MPVVLCRCRFVSLQRVRCAVLAGARSVEEVRRLCDAGADCGWCHPQIEAMIERRSPLVEPEKQRV